MCDEGWFWVIPLDSRKTSIGLVMDAQAARRVDRPAQDVLFWGIERCPLLAERTHQAVFPKVTHVIADFSYTCKPFSGPGYFLVGDAAVFLDPIFSTGICLGMVAAVNTARLLIRVLDNRLSPRRARRKHDRIVSAGSTSFFRLIEMYYDHAFRELFLHGTGPLKVHCAVITLLAGHVFPRPRFSVRWRNWLFEWIIRVHRKFPLVPARDRFSLFDAPDSAGLAAQTSLGCASSAAPVGALD